MVVRARHDRLCSHAGYDQDTENRLYPGSTGGLTQQVENHLWFRAVVEGCALGLSWRHMTGGAQKAQTGYAQKAQVVCGIRLNTTSGSGLWIRVVLG